jgi:hypothetical protein
LTGLERHAARPQSGARRLDRGRRRRQGGRTHGQPFVLALDGPAGGNFTQGVGGDKPHLDAVEFCRILSGRSSGLGPLEQEVPF